MCASTGMQNIVAESCMPSSWESFLKGWVYFYNPSLKIVTDQDIRQLETFEIIEQSYSEYPLSALTEGMEVHLHVQSLQSLQISQEPGTVQNSSMRSFNLTINHNHCVASSVFDEVKDLNSVILLGPHRCELLFTSHKVPATQYLFMSSKQMSPTLLELSMEPSSSCGNAVQSHRRCVGCSYMVLCMSLGFMTLLSVRYIDFLIRRTI